MSIILIYNSIPLVQSRDATRSLASTSGTSNKQRRPFSTSAGPGSGSGGGSGSAVTTSGSGAVIASLRGKIHSLEKALREKESALAALKREVNATRLREMEIQCEAYYREITRWECVRDWMRNASVCSSLLVDVSEAIYMIWYDWPDLTNSLQFIILFFDTLVQNL